VHIPVTIIDISRAHAVSPPSSSDAKDPFHHPDADAKYKMQIQNADADTDAHYRYKVNISKSE
jgi:hypothetical protein